MDSINAILTEASTSNLLMVAIVIDGFVETCKLSCVEMNNVVELLVRDLDNLFEGTILKT